MQPTSSNSMADGALPGAAAARCMLRPSCLRREFAQAPCPERREACLARRSGRAAPCISVCWGAQGAARGQSAATRSWRPCMRARVGGAPANDSIVRRAGRALLGCRARRPCCRHGHRRAQEGSRARSILDVFWPSSSIPSSSTHPERTLTVVASQSPRRLCRHQTTRTSRPPSRPRARAPTRAPRSTRATRSGSTSRTIIRVTRARTP